MTQILRLTLVLLLVLTMVFSISALDNRRLRHRRSPVKSINSNTNKQEVVIKSEAFLLDFGPGLSQLMLTYCRQCMIALRPSTTSDIQLLYRNDMAYFRDKPNCSFHGTRQKWSAACRSEEQEQNNTYAQEVKSQPSNHK